MKVESLIFDIDGTLWDCRAVVAEGYNAVLRREGLEHLCVDAEILKAQFGKVMTDIADDLFASVPAGERYALLDRCMAEEDRCLEEATVDMGYPKVKEVLTELAKKYRLFIVSNGQKGYCDLCEGKLGLTELIEGHLCFGDTGTEKGLTILKLMKDHHISSAVYVGDTQGDYAATVVAGLPFVYCAYGFGTPERYDYKLESFEDLLSIF